MGKCSRRTVLSRNPVPGCFWVSVLSWPGPWKHGARVNIYTWTTIAGDIHHGSSLDNHTFHDMEIHATGEKLTAEEIRQLFVVPDLPQSLHDSDGGGIDNNDTDDTDGNDEDEDDREELEEDEHKDEFEDAGKTSHETDKALMAYTLLLIEQRRLLILLTKQAKQGHSERLQSNKDTATKSLMKCDRRHERFEQELERYEASYVPVEGEQPSN